LLAHLSGTRVDTAYRLKLVDTLELSHADLRRSLREYSTGMKRKTRACSGASGRPAAADSRRATEGLDRWCSRR